MQNKEESGMSGINIIGKIKNKKIEQDFSNLEFIRLKVLLAVALVLLGLLYTAFIIPQFITGGLKNNFTAIIAARAIMLAVTECCAVVIALTKRVVVYKVLLTLIEFLYPATYFFIVYESGQYDFLIKCLDIVLIITFMFVIPNDWLNSFAAAFTTVLSFFLFSRIVIHGLDNDLFFAGVTYISLIFLTEGLFSLNISYYKRRKYLDSILLKHMLGTDYLTGINSRVKFDETCKRLIVLSRENGTPMCLVVFDIDNFKKINDTYGHIIGDRVLIGLSALISQQLTADECFARWGGEEFVLLFPDYDLPKALERVNTLKGKIGGFVFDSGVELTCSFGVAALGDLDDLDTLIDKADKLMYSAKLGGKNLVACE